MKEVNKALATNQYLKTNSFEAQQMLQNLQYLLESAEVDSLLLAFKIIEGGGIPQVITTHLFALSQWHSHENIRKQSQVFFEQIATQHLQQFLKNAWKSYYNLERNEVKIAEYLQQVSLHPEINPAVLANLKLKLTRKGGKYCLENQTAPYEQILRLLIENKRLYLNNFHLNFLPKEVGLFTDLVTLNISDNNFTTLPDEIVHLQSLEGLYFERTPLTQAQIRKLEKIFPKIFSESYYYKGCDFRNDFKYGDASQLFRRAVKLTPDFAEAWHALGSSLLQSGQEAKALQVLQKAQYYYELRLQQAPQEPYHWFCCACIAALSHDTPTALRCIGQAISLNNSYKQKAFYEEDLKNLHSLPAFRQLLA